MKTLEDKLAALGFEPYDHPYFTYETDNYTIQVDIRDGETMAQDRGDEICIYKTATFTQIKNLLNALQS